MNYLTLESPQTLRLPEVSKAEFINKACKLIVHILRAALDLHNTQRKSLFKKQDVGRIIE